MQMTSKNNERQNEDLKKHKQQEINNEIQEEIQKQMKIRKECRKARRRETSQEKKDKDNYSSYILETSAHRLRRLYWYGWLSLNESFAHSW